MSSPVRSDMCRFYGAHLWQVLRARPKRLWS